MPKPVASVSEFNEEAALEHILGSVLQLKRDHPIQMALRHCGYRSVVDVFSLTKGAIEKLEHKKTKNSNPTCMWIADQSLLEILLAVPWWTQKATGNKWNHLTDWANCSRADWLEH